MTRGNRLWHARCGYGEGWVLWGSRWYCCGVLLCLLGRVLIVRIGSLRGAPCRLQAAGMFVVAAEIVCLGGQFGPAFAEWLVELIVWEV